MRSIEIAASNGGASLRVVQGRTDGGRDLIVVQRIDASGESHPVACRPMDDAEAASYDAWLGAPAGDRNRTVALTAPPPAPQWPANGVGPAPVTASDDAAFWLHWSFARAFDGLCRTVESTRSVRGHEAV